MNSCLDSPLSKKLVSKLNNHNELQLQNHQVKSDSKEEIQVIRRMTKVETLEFPESFGEETFGIRCPLGAK